MTADLKVSLLGVPKIERGDKLVTGFVSGKASAVIYYLAATGQTQSRSTIAGLLWSDWSESAAKKNLRGALYNLRGLLGSYLEINRQSVGIHPNLAPDVDSLNFAANLSDAENSVGGSEARAAMLAEAVALYRGEFLDGVALESAELFEEWMSGERERFHLLYLQSLNELVAHYAQKGDLLDGIDYATRLLRLDPLREETHCQLMTMLAMDGQQSAALEQYRSCQRILEEELGVPPDETTTALYHKIQSGGFSRPSPIHIPTQPIAIPHNLPEELSQFINREREQQQILSALVDPTCRLLTITGMGGIGKTRLALHIAQQLIQNPREPQEESIAYRVHCADGIYHIPLAGLDAGNQLEHLLATTVATTLQIPLTGQESPVQQLTHALQNHEMLLIFDNFEHLLNASLFIVNLLENTHKLKILVTSRVRLHVRGEQIVTLDGLSIPPVAHAYGPVDNGKYDAQVYDGPHLFAQVARAVSPDFVWSPSTASAVARICQLVEGVPLAIELSATWTRLLPCEEISAEIQQNLDFLADGMVDLPERHQSLRAVFDQSWQLLNQDEQRALRQLAIFRGGFTRSAAVTVAGATLPLLASLVDRSLVRRVDAKSIALGRAGPGASARYELLEIVRQYASEQLALAGETDATSLRHVKNYAAFLAQRLSDLQGGEQRAALGEISSEIENIRSSWHWLENNILHHDEALGLIAESIESLFHFYDMRSWFQEGEATFGQMAKKIAEAHTTGNATAEAIYAKLQARRGWFLFHLGRLETGHALLKTSLETLRKQNTTTEPIFNLNYLGAVMRHRGAYEEAQSYLNEGLELARTHGDLLGQSIAYNILGQVALLQGNLDLSRTYCQQAAQIKDEIGDRWGITYSLTYLGRIAQAQGDFRAANQLFHESKTISEELGDKRGVAFALQNLADTATLTENWVEAEKLYQDSLQRYREIGNLMEASLTLAKLGEVALALLQQNSAVSRFRESLTMAQSIRSVPALLTSLLGMAQLHMATDKQEIAVRQLRLIVEHPGSNQSLQSRAEDFLTALSDDLQEVDSSVNLDRILSTLVEEALGMEIQTL